MPPILCEVVDRGKSSQLKSIADVVNIVKLLRLNAPREYSVSPGRYVPTRYGWLTNGSVIG
jgi:hypothetical protein